MAIRANRNISNWLVPPLGYPVTLSPNREVELNGVIPKGVTSVTVSAYASKTATLHLALHDTPATSTLPLADGAILSYTNPDTGEVSYAKSEVALDSTEIESTISVPEWETVLTPYLFRCWVSDVTGDTLDETVRKSGVAEEDQPYLPGYVTITKVVIG